MLLDAAITMGELLKISSLFKIAESRGGQMLRHDTVMDVKTCFLNSSLNTAFFNSKMMENVNVAASEQQIVVVVKEESAGRKWRTGRELLEIGIQQVPMLLL